MGVSLDGFIVGPDGKFDWAAPGEELHRFHNQQARETGVQLYGRRLYETMLYWDTIDALPGHVEVIEPDSPEDIHAVTAVGEEPTISIHVYGADIEARGTSIYRRFDDWPVRPADWQVAA